MRIVDSRRVTGPNLAARESGAAIDLALDADDDAVAVIAAWRTAIARVLPWPGELRARRYAGGVALFVPGPVDVLLPLTDLNEYAVACAAAALRGEPEPAPPTAILADISAARIPGLAELRAAARARDRLVLIDDIAITLGAGRGGVVSFARGEPLPAPDQIDWANVGHIPIALVTGTNGKTTTTRMIAKIAQAAGLACASTSSDGVLVDGVVVERGDFSGPEGARLALRRTDIDLAVLETARGGILRRGLAVERCAAALITNVSADHLRDYGVDDVATMARVKAVIASVAARVVVNAADPQLVALADELAAGGREVRWFGGDGDRDRGGGDGARAHPRWFVRGGELVVRDPDIGAGAGADAEPVVAIADLPSAFAGAAPYNIENALAAAALADALAIPRAAIAAGLRGFSSSNHDNPGRGNLLAIDGVRVLLDFGHNAAAIAAVLGLARAIVADGGRALRITIGMPGDRDDHELVAVARAVAAGAPAEVCVRELPRYLLRGRALGAVTSLLAGELARAGIAVSRADDERAAFAQLFAASRPGDLVLVLAHLDGELGAELVARDSLHSASRP